LPTGPNGSLRRTKTKADLGADDFRGLIVIQQADGKTRVASGKGLPAH
jgi:hypothetical protein